MNPKPEILIFPDKQSLARAAAERFVGIGDEAIAKNGRFAVSLAGGSTPMDLYKLLASKYAERLEWDKCLFFIGDERDVPPDDEKSNFRMATETLFAPLKIPDGQIVRWMTELDDRAETAAEYGRQLQRLDGGFDLCLLGLGDDCHTASLFPHHLALMEEDKMAVAAYIETLDEWRFTTTLKAINRADNVMFLVTGRSKSNAVRDVIEAEADVDLRPAQGVSPSNGALTWLLDAEAASKLTGI